MLAAVGSGQILINGSPCGDNFSNACRTDVLILVDLVDVLQEILSSLAKLLTTVSRLVFAWSIATRNPRKVRVDTCDSTDAIESSMYQFRGTSPAAEPNYRYSDHCYFVQSLRMLRQFGHWIQQNRSLTRFQAPSLIPSTISRKMSQNAIDTFLQKRTLPPFRRIEISHLEKALNNVVHKAREDLKALETQLDHKLTNNCAIEWKDVVDPLELQSDALDRLWGLVGHLMSVKNNDEIRNVHDQFQGPVTETITSMSQSRQLYKSFLKLSKSILASKMDPGHAVCSLLRSLFSS